MTIKYFTGNGLSAHKVKVRTGSLSYPTSRSGKTTSVLTTNGISETEPVTTEDGVDPKPNRTVDGATDSKYTRARIKVFSKTGDSIGKAFENNVGCIGMKGGKARASMLKGKYELGKMWKYRKTLKRLMTDIGFTAQSGSVGERNMYNGKNIGRIGNYKSIEDANDQCLMPLSGLK